MKRERIKQIRQRFAGPRKHVADHLIAVEREAEFRDRRRAKFCPVCGRKPEIPLEQSGRHIYNGHCEKCQVRFVIHIC